MSVLVYGSSDDLIEVEGDVEAEFYGEDGYVALSNGTLLKITYNGNWLISSIRGKAKITHYYETDSAYSDKAHINDEIYWVVYGEEYEYRRN